MNIIIFGGTSGIGANLAKRYFCLGHQVIVIGRNRKKFDDNFKGAFQKITFETCNIIQALEVRKKMKALQEKKNIDLYIICSGVGVNHKTLSEEMKHSERLISTNILGSINAVEAAIEKMLTIGRGHIVLIGSLAGIMGFPKNSVYGASKAAIHHLGESWFFRFKNQGVKVTTVAPGFVDTPLTQNNDHKMPFLLSVNDAGEKIQKAIEERKRFYAFPCYSYYFLKILSCLPESWIWGILAKLNLYQEREK